MGLLVSVLAGVFPMLFYAWFLYYLDRYEKEPLPLLAGVFSWGALIAAGAAFLINSFGSMGIYLITKSAQATQITVSTLIAPIVEETLKGMAVFLIYILYKSEFDSPLDGLVYSGITALGFAATENIWYIHQLGYLENSWQGVVDLTLVRVILVGWQHPFYTAFTGLGFALSRRSLKTIWKWLFPLIGWTAAVVFHLIHNLLAIVVGTTEGWFLSTIWDWSGYLGLLILILLLIRREQSWMRKYLRPDLKENLISMDQYQIICSAWRQSLAFIRALFQGNYRQTRRFYQLCGEYMHKRRQLLRHGDELGSALEIKRLRSTITLLAAEIGSQR